MTPIRSLDALRPGQEFELGQFSLPRAEVLEFAGRFDPQPFHVDEAAARDSIFGGLVASGMHTLSAAFGQAIRTGFLGDVNLGGNAMDLRWPAPLRPDEAVALRAVVENVRPSKTRPEMGVAQLRYTGTRIADGVVVLDVLVTHFMKR